MFPIVESLEFLNDTFLNRDFPPLWDHHLINVLIALEFHMVVTCSRHSHILPHQRGLNEGESTNAILPVNM